MKFGKYLESRQLELPDYNGHFIDYKSLKKLIKQLVVSPSILAGSSLAEDTTHFDLDSIDETIIYQRLQENKSTFFFRLDRELEKINSFYMEKELDLTVKFNILNSKFQDYCQVGQQIVSKKNSNSFRNIYDAFLKLQTDLNELEQYIELNRTGFSKALKKWDKRSHSHEKEFYLATVVTVQPIFTRNKVAQLNDATLTILMELNDMQNNSPPSRVNNDNDSNKINNIRNASTDDTDKIVMDRLRTPNQQTTDTLLEDTEEKIDHWYIEVINTSNLRDETRRRDLLSTFIELHIKKELENVSNTIDVDTILKGWITRLFFLLMSSNMTDESLFEFYKSAKQYINLSYCDEADQVYSRKNILHEACNCPRQSRIFILQDAIQQFEEGKFSLESLKALLNAKDIHLRIPLHYACEGGKLDFVQLLLQTKLMNSVNTPDNVMQTPLLLALINNHLEIMKLLLQEEQLTLESLPSSSSSSSSSSSLKYLSPLNVACQYNNFEAAELLLAADINLLNVSDTKGLTPLHIVAKNGTNETNSRKLVQLLIQKGANPNALDTFNKWTPIFYAIQRGQREIVDELLKNGADLAIKDDENRSPLHLTIWESNIQVLNTLLPYLKKQSVPRIDTVASLSKPPVQQQQQQIDSSIPDIDNLSDLDEEDMDDGYKDVSEFTLPPPIIPLRKYGHNFLEKKILVKISLPMGNDCIQLNKDKNLILATPGRVTITPNISDMLPRNIILPIGKDIEEGSEEINITGETGQIIFQVDSLKDFAIDFEIFPIFGSKLIAKSAAMSQLFNNVNLLNSIRTLTLPLFDTRLNTIGSFLFQFQIIFPYPGKPLQITKYEPYWKSTNTGSSNNADSIKNDQHQLITSSSLGGTFVNIKIYGLNDGTIICASDLYLKGKMNMFLNDLTRDQLETMCGYDITDVPSVVEDEQDLQSLLISRIFQFDSLLSRLPKWMQLVFEVCYPTQNERENIPVKMSRYMDMNKYIDGILHIIFEHERELRHSGGNIRSIVFQSVNSNICSILNWKQPNFPVFLSLNSILVPVLPETNFRSNTPNRLLKMEVNKDKCESWDKIGIHSMVDFSVSNNLLGIIIPAGILELCPSIVSSIKKRGLLLVGSYEDKTVNMSILNEMPLMNGLQGNSELIFKEDINMY
ncbi:hypothetical protein NCAS_0F00580 [Naumovozyma castellii]|uniref:Phosphate system positive regulatory protein PHO81 n=1 Tax=Naumovozyma castellii TaxID=27288 RepID=G0VGC2_NAUCA|nr:hypothetical protein NCAS_0F00580 [Naumovozyma castellii CBS 4309]CCC70542.1 hypothetical protein NCAS_0F00580 [Naumovozyma castellii CBS 4309]